MMMEAEGFGGQRQGEEFAGSERGGINGRKRDDNSFIIPSYFSILGTHDKIKRGLLECPQCWCVRILRKEHWRYLILQIGGGCCHGS